MVVIQALFTNMTLQCLHMWKGLFINCDILYLLFSSYTNDPALFAWISLTALSRTYCIWKTKELIWINVKTMKPSRT